MAIPGCRSGRAGSQGAGDSGPGGQGYRSVVAHGTGAFRWGRERGRDWLQGVELYGRCCVGSPPRQHTGSSRQGMRPSTAIRAFRWGLLASFIVSAQVSELPPLRPVVGVDEPISAPEPEPEPEPPQHCHFWQDCWKLTVPSAHHENGCGRVCLRNPHV